MSKTSNTYKGLEEEKATLKTKKTGKSNTKRKTKKAKPAKVSSKINLLKPLTNLFAKENKRLNLTIGSILLLLSTYLILAFISYLFTWKADQNLVIDQRFFSFIFLTKIAVFSLIILYLSMLNTFLRVSNLMSVFSYKIRFISSCGV